MVRSWAVRGVVVSEPEERLRSQRFVVRVDSLREVDAWVETSGRVQVTARLFPRYRYGDVAELHGGIETPPRFESFDYREYLARRGIVSVALLPRIQVLESGRGSMLQRTLIALREPFGRALERSLPEPESALARGILLGQRASIPTDLTSDFNDAGISHLVAISGYNVMLIAAFVTAGLGWLTGRRQATLIAMLLVVAYAAFVGGSPSVLRAALMAQVMLGATLAGRPGSALRGVLIAGAVLVAWQPLIIDDVSFQLSFAATLGIVLLAERARAWLQGRLSFLPEGAAAFFSEQLSVTVAASVAVLPVIATSFGRLSIVSLPANLLAVPVFPLTLAASFVTAAAGAVDEGAGRFVGEFAILPLSFLVWLGRTAADLPLAALSLGDVGLVESLLLYALGGTLVLLLSRRKPLQDEDRPRGPRLSPALAASALLLALALPLWLGVFDDGHDRLRVTVLDVGQGDAILIETPSGHRLLMDGGPSGAALMQALGRELPATARRIDLLVLSHAQDDHVTGLVEVLQRYEVLGVLEGPLAGETAAYRAWAEELERRQVPVHRAIAGDSLDLGHGVRVEVISPGLRLIEGTRDDLNNNSVVLRLVHGQVSFLLTGDLAAEGEIALLESGFDLSSMALKVGHHGSDSSTTPEFLEAIRPALAVISAGAENNFGHPSPSVRLRLAGIPSLRTDKNGDVRMTTDGERLWVELQRGDHELVPAGIGR
jgi:competence protein ComEC